MRVPVVVTAVLLVLLPGCELPFSSAASEKGVVATVGAAGVEIRNQGSGKAFYTVMDASYAARVMWVQCVTSACPGVAAGRNVTIAPADVGGWGESSELIVYWWRRVPTVAGYEPGPLNAIPLQY